ncbi:hypothetical protein QHF85_17060 [Polyangium sp. 6x1]|nr:hypothetical protein [Polyangium sp. 6x1]
MWQLSRTCSEGPPTHGTWTKVAHLLRFRRSVDLAFLDGTNPGNMALARSIARAVGSSSTMPSPGRRRPAKRLRSPS